MSAADDEEKGTGRTIEYRPDGRITGKSYDRELLRLQEDLVDLQKWVKHEGLRVAVIFEGRDASGKGGVIKRITQRLSHRIVRVVALGIPTEREHGQWYFQRYVPHLPAAGEMVLFDRSWYNRAGVERVMGFCTDEEYREFLRSCPDFERMLVRSGIILIKYWFAISPEEQERRFRSRLEDPRKRWKIGPVDIAALDHWTDYSRAKDAMFTYTDIEEAPWHMVGADVKRHARLNCIHHLLQAVPWKEIPDEPVELPDIQEDPNYHRPPSDSLPWVPEVYGSGAADSDPDTGEG
jgi:polyphosphate kinase 2